MITAYLVRDVAYYMKEIELNIKEELEYLESFGIEIAKLEDEPAPLGSIKLAIEKLDLNPLEDIKEISMMSYNAKDSIAYIEKKHVTDTFSIKILAHKSTMDKGCTIARIKQIPSEFEYTEHQNLIELNSVHHIETTDIKGNKVATNTNYLMFLEPFHNGKEFGEFYEKKKKNIKLSKQDENELDLLKARLYIPTQKVVQELKKSYSL